MWANGIEFTAAKSETGFDEICRGGGLCAVSVSHSILPSFSIGRRTPVYVIHCRCARGGMVWRCGRWFAGLGSGSGAGESLFGSGNRQCADAGLGRDSPLLPLSFYRLSRHRADRGAPPGQTSHSGGGGRIGARSVPPQTVGGSIA